MIQAARETIPNSRYWKAYRESHDEESFNLLVTQYLHLVEQMASRLYATIPANMVAREDLVGMGYIGLIEAIQKFDYQKGFQFETFGIWRIKGAMLDGLRQLDWVPRGMRDKAKSVNNAHRELEQKLWRTPTEEEVSEFLDLPQEEVRQSMSILSMSTLLSLNEPDKAGGEKDSKVNRLDQLADESSLSQDQHIQLTQLKELVADCLEKMPEKEKLVISLLYYEGLSQVETAEVLSLTKGRISQIHSNAIMRFRRYLEAKGYPLDTIF